MRMDNKRALLVGATALALPRAIQGLGVRADMNDPKAMIEALTKAFEEFKAANDEKIRSKADVVAEEKVGRINDAVSTIQAAVDDLNRRLASAQLGGAGAGETPERRAYSEAFAKFFRTGEGDRELKALAVRAQLNRGSDPDGGYVVSPEIEQAIDRVLGTVSVMRQLATVRTTGASVYKKRVGQGGATSGWAGENETRSATSTPSIAELEFPAMTLYANPEATEEMLDDADFDIAMWLADEVNIEFAEEEGAAHISGNGVKKPRGILGYDTVADDSWSWGKLGYKVSGHATTIPDFDGLMDLTSALKQGFRAGASWLMNRKTEAAIRKLQDGDGKYLWQPSIEVGKPATILGYAQYADDNMPDVAADAFPVAFGDFRRGYLIADRRGVRVLRNPYLTPGVVSFYTTKRTGGGVQHFQAIKLLKISA